MFAPPVSSAPPADHPSQMSAGGLVAAPEVTAAGGVMSAPGEAGRASSLRLSMLLTGLYQFYQNTHLSRWYARSSVIVKDEMIQNPTGMRFVDGNLFG